MEDKKNYIKENKRKYVDMKKSLDNSLYNELAAVMCVRVHTELVSLSTSMIEMG